jgi:hypothetical protein
MSDMSVGKVSDAALAAHAVDVAQARERWKVDIIKELKVRGATADEAHLEYDNRARDYERARRSNWTPAQAVTNVTGGSWAERSK